MYNDIYIKNIDYYITYYSEYFKKWIYKLEWNIK